MTIEDLKADVQTEFPLSFEETLMYADDSNIVSKIVTRAVRKALSHYELTKAIRVTGTSNIPEAINVLKCTYSDDASSSGITVWDLMPVVQTPGLQPIRYHFGSDRILRVYPSDSEMVVTYLVDPAFLTIEDLNQTYYDWAVNYSLALCSIKEGGLGRAGQLTELPFEFNHSAMHSEGMDSKKELEERLEEMYMGTLAIRSS